MKKLTIIFILFFLVSCTQPTNLITIKTQSGPVEFSVDLAQTPAQQAQGLMNVSNMPLNHGMLFIFDKEQELTFWMKNTLIPLDMIFLNKDQEIVNIIHNAQPEGLEEKTEYPVYASKVPAQYVLEINGGQAKALNINVGDVWVGPIRQVQ